QLRMPLLLRRGAIRGLEELRFRFVVAAVVAGGFRLAQQAPECDAPERSLPYLAVLRGELARPLEQLSRAGEIALLLRRRRFALRDECKAQPRIRVVARSVEELAGARDVASLQGGEAGLLLLCGAALRDDGEPALRL